MNNKFELDRRVARALHADVTEVARITEEFLAQVSALLAESGHATIGGFGQFKVRYKKLSDEVTLTKGLFKKGVQAGTMTVHRTACVQVGFVKSSKLKALLHAAYKEKPDGEV